MKVIRTLIYLLILEISFLSLLDVFNYVSTYFVLNASLPAISEYVSQNGGITKTLKEEMAKKEIYFIYEVESDMNGELFSFEIYKEVELIIFGKTKTKIPIVVLLGY